jgi:hypothetical protein
MLRFCRDKGLGTAMVLLLSLLAPAATVAQVAWVKDFDDALKQAAKEKKFIVLDVSASW